MRQIRFFSKLLLVLALLGLGAAALASVDFFAIDPSAALSSGKTILTVSGSVTCSSGTLVENVGVVVFQGNGPNQTVGGGGQRGFACTGSPQTWQVLVNAESGQLWHPGSATAIASLSTCIGSVWPEGVICETWTGSVLIDSRLQVRQ